MMKTLLKTACTLVVSVLACSLASAQEQRYEYVDSVVYVPTASLDSSLVGRDALADLTVHQSKDIADAFRSHVSRNQARVVSGYRVRIFFDNSQSSRSVSEATLSAFRSRYPGYAAYRSYVNPYFKVTVGDFRTRSEAMQLLQLIKPSYPSAFIVKENINYPVVDREHAYVVDTVKVLRKVSAPDYFNL